MRTFAYAVALSMFLFAGCDRSDRADGATAYPLEYCIVSGDRLDSMGESKRVVHEGREVLFCCKGCVKDFEKDPDAWLAKIDAAVEAGHIERPADAGKTKKKGHGHHGHKGHEHHER